MDNKEKAIQLIEDLTEIANNHERNAKRLFRIAEKLIEEYKIKYPEDESKNEM